MRRSCPYPQKALGPIRQPLLVSQPVILSHDSHYVRLSLRRFASDFLSSLITGLTYYRCPFPYSMGLHQAPLPPLDPNQSIAHTHFHFYPPLLRSASVRKFLVGFEMMGEAQVGWSFSQVAASPFFLLSTFHSSSPQSISTVIPPTFQDLKVEK